MSSRLIKNASLNTIKTIFGLLFPLITFPYISRILGVEGIGIYNFSSSFLSYFLLLSALGISTYGIREGAPLREHTMLLQKFVGELFSINLLSMTIAYLGLFICVFCIPVIRNYQTAILILSGEIFFSTIGVSWICNIFEDFFIIAVRTIAFQLISLILLFSFVHSASDLNIYLCILLISNSGAYLFNFFYIRKKYLKFHITFDIDWKQHLKPILIIFASTLSITIYVSSDTFILGIMTNDYQVGLYGTAVKIYSVIKNILVAVLMVMIPHFSVLFSQKDNTHISVLFSKVFNVLTLLMFPLCVGLFTMSDDVILLISGAAFLQASLTLKLLCLAVIFSLLAFMYTQCVLIPIKQERLVLIATAVSAGINIILNLFFIPLWGINGAAITTIIAEFVIFLFAFYHSNKIVPLLNIKHNILSVFIGCFFISLVCLCSQKIDSFFYRIVVSVVGSIAIYSLILFIMKNPIVKQVKETLNNFVSYHK